MASISAGNFASTSWAERCRSFDHDMPIRVTVFIDILAHTDHHATNPVDSRLVRRLFRGCNPQLAIARTRRLEPTTRAHTNQEQTVVNRHGSRSSHAATPPSWKCPEAPFALICSMGLNMRRGRFPTQRSPWRRNSTTNSPSSPESRQLRRHNGRAKPEIPIDHDRSPAGSCLGGFRAGNCASPGRAPHRGIIRPCIDRPEKVLERSRPS